MRREKTRRFGRKWGQLFLIPFHFFFEEEEEEETREEAKQGQRNLTNRARNIAISSLPLLGGFRKWRRERIKKKHGGFGDRVRLVFTPFHLLGRKGVGERNEGGLGGRGRLVLHFCSFWCSLGGFVLAPALGP